MRGGSPSDREVRASELNLNFVGQAVAIDLPDGSELCTTVKGVRWAESGAVGVYLAVPHDDFGSHYIELARDAMLLVAGPSD